MDELELPRLPRSASGGRHLIAGGFPENRPASEPEEGASPKSPSRISRSFDKVYMGLKGYLAGKTYLIFHTKTKTR